MELTPLMHILLSQIIFFVVFIDSQVKEFLGRENRNDIFLYVPFRNWTNLQECNKSGELWGVGQGCHRTWKPGPWQRTGVAA